MARRDVLHYYYDIQKSYLEMVDVIKEVEDSYKNGNIDYDRYSDLLERLSPEIEKSKEVYELMSYVMFLYNIPQRPKKGEKYRKQNEVYFKYLKKYSSEEKIKEQEEGLKKIREIIDEVLKHE